MVSLRDSLQILTIAIDFSIELKTVFTQELWGDIDRLEVGGVFVGSFW